MIYLMSDTLQGITHLFPTPHEINNTNNDFNIGCLIKISVIKIPHIPNNNSNYDVYIT